MFVARTATTQLRFLQIVNLKVFVAHPVGAILACWPSRPTLGRHGKLAKSATFS